MNKNEALPVIKALQKHEADIKDLMGMISGKRFVNSIEKNECQKKLKNLKENLQIAVNYGTVDGSQRDLTRYEREYFQPAVKKALANCNVRFNSHPIQSNWFSCLSGMSIDITHLLPQLTEHHPND